MNKLPAPKMVGIGQIRPNPTNPRIIKDLAFESLKRSIQDFPEMLRLRPIVVDATGMILGGNMRYEACKALGIEQVPVLYADDLPNDKLRRFVIADNVGFGEWDWDMLANQFDADELANWGLDMPEMAEDVEADEDNYVPAIPREPGIKDGDLIQIGPHRLLCGDSADPEQMRRLMDSKLADMVFTDPPYGVSYVGKTKDALTIESDDVKPDVLKQLVSSWFDNVGLFTKGGGYLLATVPAGPLHLIFANDWVERGWLRQILVWNKSSMVLGHSEYHYKHEPILFGWKPGGNRMKNPDRTRTTVWDFEKPSASREHPTMKPVSMWAYGIKNHSKPGDIILEPFGGSGTTMVAAHQIGRKCYAMEMDPLYCRVIVDRMIAMDANIEISLNGNPWNPNQS